jgi:hypothetical protein
VQPFENAVNSMNQPSVPMPTGTGPPSRSGARSP